MKTKIIEVSAEPYQLKFKSVYKNARVVTPNNHYVRVQVKSGDCVGVGEVSPMPGYSAETSLSITEAVNNWFGPAVMELDVFDSNEIDHRVARTLPDNWYAKAALDMALWDLRARSLGVSAATLFGGKARSEVPIGAVIALSDPQSMAREAGVWMERGAQFFQCKIAEDAASSVARISAIRQVVGTDVEIAVDGNASFSLIAARNTVEAIEKFDIKYFEQPLQRYELDGMATLVADAPFPIVADESLHSALDAMRLCDRKAANGFNVKLSKSGISESKRIIAIAEAAGIPYGLGTMFESKRGTLASVQFAASIPAPFYPTEAVGPWMVEDPDDVPGLQLADGALAWKVPTGPGWGCS